MLDRTHPPCLHCEEPIRPGDKLMQLSSGELMHMECFVRMTLGSVAHLRRRCRCFIPGSTEEDPPGMTKREAALAATETVRFINQAAIMNEDGACFSCGSRQFHPGPRGGAAHNVMCAECGVKYWYCPPFAPDRVYNEDEVYDLSRSLTLDAITSNDAR